MRGNLESPLATCTVITQRQEVRWVNDPIFVNYLT